MKTFKEILTEEDKPIPETIVNAWKEVIGYDAKMKQKFSYFDVTFKSKGFTPGHKGQMTKVHKKFENAVKEHNLDMNLTIRKLYNLYPPTYI